MVRVGGRGRRLMHSLHDRYSGSTADGHLPLPMSRG